MSTSTPSIGIDHPTVVPTNFDPAGRDGEFDDADGSEADADVDCEASGTDSDDVQEP